MASVTSPWIFCDMAESRGLDPVNRADVRGGVVFCPYCQGTAANHRRVLMRDGRIVTVAARHR